MTTETNAPYSSTHKDIYVNELEVFFKLLFGKATNGYLCIAVLNPDTKQMSHHWFSYPQELPQVVECAEEFGTTHNVYFCPQLFTKQSRNKEYVLCAPNVWADLDTCPPDKLLVKPSVLVESSPGRYHAYWILDDYEMPIEDIFVYSAHPNVHIKNKYIFSENKLQHIPVKTIKYHELQHI